jgi:hypothetical protein
MIGALVLIGIVLLPVGLACYFAGGETHGKAGDSVGAGSVAGGGGGE